MSKHKPSSVVSEITSVEIRGKKRNIVLVISQKNPFTKFFFFFGTKCEIKKQTNKNQIQTNTAEVHAFIVVICSSADCKTERTIVHEKHNSPKRTHLTYSQSQVLFIYSIFITFIHVYGSCLDLWLMICESLWNAALSPSCWVAVLVSHISKLKALMGFRSSGEFFLFLGGGGEGGTLWDGSWSSGFDCVLSHCSSLTDIWKVPLGKYSGLPGLNAEFLYCRRQLAAASKRCTHRLQRTLCPALMGECLFIYSWM